MASWLWFFTIWSGWQVELPGPEAPVMAFEGKSSIYLVREGQGGATGPWYLTSGSARPVVLPPKTRFVAASPDSEELFAVTDDGLFKFSPWDIKPRRDSRQLAVQGRHPWLVAQRVDTPNWRGFTFFDQGRWWLVPWDVTRPIQSYEASFQAPGPSDDALAWWQPRVWTRGETAFWMDDRALYPFVPGDAKEPSSLRVPEAGEMERIAALPDGEDVYWLVYGGERGDLDSFGWTVRDSNRAVKLSGEGIVTGHHWQTLTQGSRLWVATVSRSFSAHLWLSVRGKVKYQLHMATVENGRFQMVETREITLSEADDGFDAKILWDTDLTGDGLTDLVTLDPKSGLRYFPAESKGGLARSDQALGQRASRLLALPNRLIRAEKGENAWQIEVLP